MSVATGIRDQITSVIDTYGSTVVITPRTPTIGDYGGYEPGDDNSGTAVTTIGVPSSYLKGSNGQTFGKLEEGEVNIVLKYSETIDKDYNVTWDSNNYKVKEIKDIYLQDVLVAKRVRLSRRLD